MAVVEVSDCPRGRLTERLRIAYHSGMPGARVHWTLVFSEASLEHLAERNIEVVEIADAVYGQYGRARIRGAGGGGRQRWFVMALLESGELLTCVFRPALSAGSRDPGRLRHFA